jgi:hypothetical protein
LMGGQQSLRGLELVIHRPKCPFTPVVHSAFRLVQANLVLDFEVAVCLLWYSNLHTFSKLSCF